MTKRTHIDATQLAVDAMVDELVREHVQDLERRGAYGQPFPGEPDRAIEDDWFTYDIGSRPVALGDVVQIGPGCFRAKGFGGAE